MAEKTLDFKVNMTGDKAALEFMGKMNRTAGQILYKLNQISALSQQINAGAGGGGGGGGGGNIPVGGGTPPGGKGGGAPPNLWKAAGGFGPIGAAMKGIGAGVTGAGTMWQNYANNIANINKQLTLGNLLTRQIYVHMMPMLHSMFGFTRGVLGFGFGGTTGMFALAGAGMAGIYKLGSDVYSRQMFAAGVGSNIGQVTAGETYLRRYGDITGGIQRVGRAAIGSPEYLALSQLGLAGQLGKEDSSIIFEQAMRRFAQRYKGVDISRMLPVLQASGFQDLFGDVDTMRRLTQDPEGVIKDFKKAQAEAKKFDPNNPKDWQDFMDHLKGAGKEIETVLINKVGEYLPQLNNLIDATKKGAEAFINNLIPTMIKFDQAIKQILKFFTDWLNKWIPKSIPGFGGEDTFIQKWLRNWFKNNLGIDLESGETTKPDDTTTATGQGRFFGRGKGGQYMPNKLWGGKIAGGNLSLTATKTMSPEERAMLDVIAYHEAAPGTSYLSPDPDPGAAFKGNRYQFLGKTWRDTAREIGADPTDTSPTNQDRVALALLTKLARQKGLSLSDIAKNPSLMREFGSTWHGLWTFNTEKVFQKALENEKREFIETNKPKLKSSERSLKPGSIVKDVTGGHQFDFPAPTEHVYGPQSLNNINNFQDKGRGHNVTVFNKTGSSLLIQSAMLGMGEGNFQS